MINQINRRAFLRSSLATTATLALSARAWSQVPGANEDIRIAVIGFGGRGGDHIHGYRTLRKNGEKVRIVALCDVDKEIMAKALKGFTDQGEEVATFTDLRQVLDQKNIDAVSIATPNHWHSLATIWACQA